MDELNQVDPEQWRPLWQRELEDQERRTADLARRVGALFGGDRSGRGDPSQLEEFRRGELRSPFEAP